MATITFLAYDRCMASGISGLMDAFSIANLWHHRFERGGRIAGLPSDPLFDMELVTPHGKPFTTNQGARILPDRAMEAVTDTDLILIPSYLFGTHPMPVELPEMLEWIVAQYQRRVRIGAVCTGAFILAMTGLLDGKIATTNWQVARRFKQEFPDVRLKPERILTEDSGLICSGAVTALYNLALYVIESYGSKDLTRACAKALLVDPNRSAQTPYMIPTFSKSHGDREILNAQQWMEEHYEEQISVDEVARHVGISPRHFKRRFKRATHETPLSYIQQLRMESAKKLLETTTDAIDEITRKIGYEDSSAFRRLFKKHAGLSPREYRGRFGRRQSCI